MSRRTIIAWLVGIGLGVAAGVVAALIVGRTPDPVKPTPLPPAGDRVQAAIDGVRADHFYVAPEVRDRLTPAQTTALTAQAKKSKAPLYVVYWSSTYNGGYHNDYQALDQLIAGVGDDGYYAVIPDDGSALVQAHGLQNPYVDPELAKGRADQGLTRYIAAMAAVPPERDDPTTGSDSDYWGGPGGGLAAGALFSGGGFLVLLLLVWLASFVRRPR